MCEKDMKNATVELFLRICIGLYVIRLRRDLFLDEYVDELICCVIGRTSSQQREYMMYERIRNVQTVNDAIRIIRNIRKSFSLPLSDPVMECIHIGVSLMYEFRKRTTRVRRKRIIRLRTRFCNLLYHCLLQKFPHKAFVETEFWIAYENLYEVCVLNTPPRYNYLTNNME